MGAGIDYIFPWQHGICSLGTGTLLLGMGDQESWVRMDLHYQRS